MRTRTAMQGSLAMVLTLILGCASSGEVRGLDGTSGGFWPSDLRAVAVKYHEGDSAKLANAFGAAVENAIGGIVRSRNYRTVNRADTVILIDEIERALTDPKYRKQYLRSLGADAILLVQVSQLLTQEHKKFDWLGLFHFEETRRGRMSWRPRLTGPVEVTTATMSVRLVTVESMENLWSPVGVLEKTGGESVYGELLLELASKLADTIPPRIEKPKGSTALSVAGASG